MSRNRDSLDSLHAPRSRTARYATALAAVAVATLLRFPLNPLLGESGFALYFAAVAIAAWVGGLGPCLLAQVLSLAVSVYFFKSEPDTESDSLPRAIAGIGAFFFVGIAIALLSEATRAAQGRALAQAREAIGQREQLRSTLSCIGDAVIATDGSGRVTTFNASAEELTGYSVDEASGQPVENVVRLTRTAGEVFSESPIHSALRQEGSTTAKWSERSIGDPCYLAARDGRRIPVAFSVAPIQDGAGRTIGAVMIVRDETERLRAAEALLEADRKKDVFLATLSHELRNPLAPIRTGLEVMKLAGDDLSTIARIRSTMERQTQQIVRLIDDLLDVSRITRGKLQLQRETVSLIEIMQTSVEAVRQFIDDAGHHLTIDWPESELRVHADPARLAQVISNLLHNAAKYTPPPGEIHLVATRVGNGRSETSSQCADEWAEIRVRDNGLGIPKDHQERIFEMFAQIDRPIEGNGGLGIGLTLVQSLVEMHGGTIEVQSEGAGLGSEFIVRLPLATAGGADRPDAREDVASAATALPRKVLIVDDNPAALEMLGVLVKMCGHAVHTARDGAEAIAAADLFHPDVIFMDLGMPVLDGYEAAKKLRQRPWFEGTLLVAVTGWGQEQDRQRSKEAGFDHHLVKPVEAAKLRQLIDELANPTAGKA